MEDSALNAVLGALKNKKPKQMRDETVKEVREALQMPRKEIMSLTLQQATQLLTGLLEDDRVQELSRQNIHITLSDVACSSPRKPRSDRGVPRKTVKHAPDIEEAAGEPEASFNINGIDADALDVDDAESDVA